VDLKLALYLIFDEPSGFSMAKHTLTETSGGTRRFVKDPRKPARHPGLFAAGYGRLS
jgi:hypothetical protein